MTGVGGGGLTVTVSGADGGLTQPSTVSMTVNVPEDDTVIDGVVSLSLHRSPDAADELRTTLPP